MIHSKNNKSGFTLIEVLFATAIVGIVLIPIFSLQTRVTERLIKTANEVQRIFIAFDFFLEAQLKPEKKEKPLEKRTEFPTMQLRFKVEDVSEGSSIVKAFNNLKLEKASYEWVVEGKKLSNELISFVFYPPKPKPEKEDKDSKDNKDAAKSGQKPAAAAGQAGVKPAAGAKK